MRQCSAAVTRNPAKITRPDGYGLEPGRRADFVLLPAHDPVKTIRLLFTRLKVYRYGKLAAESPAATVTVHLPGRPAHTSKILHETD